MPKQLSRCCKAEIELTWEDRPNHFKCSECGRIIWEPYEIKYLDKDTLEEEAREDAKWYYWDNQAMVALASIQWNAVKKINEIIDAVNKLQELARCAESSLAVDTKSIDSLLLQVSQQQEAIDDMANTIAKLRQYETATDTNVGTKRAPLDDLVDEIDELYPIEETRQITIRKKALRKMLERYL